MNYEDAKLFCEKWLRACTGNNPEELIEFYLPQSFCSDQTVKDGLKGHDKILPYFKNY